jgi:hypothetical protein
VAATIVAIMAVALGLGGAVATSRNLSCVRMGESEPEASVVPLVQRAQIQGRLVVWFDWGEYAIWHFAPELLVSIDGRRETVYSDAVMAQHLAFYTDPSTRARFLQDVRPDHVWLPPALPIVSSLRADGWTTLHAGPRSVWLQRPGLGPASDSPSFVPQPDDESASRCFPGP